MITFKEYLLKEAKSKIDPHPDSAEDKLPPMLRRQAGHIILPHEEKKAKPGRPKKLTMQKKQAW